MNIHQITFSPTGGTARVCRCLCREMEFPIVPTDLCVSASELFLPLRGEGIGPLLGMLTERLKPLCSSRRENELFI